MGPWTRSSDGGGNPAELRASSIWDGVPKKDGGKCDTGGGECGLKVVLGPGLVLRLGLGLELCGAGGAGRSRWCGLTRIALGGVNARASAASRRWKLRWQPHAAHFSEAGSAGSEMGLGKNSPQPSSAWPPMLAAWFFRHSL